MDFDAIERFDLEQGPHWGGGGASLVATKFGGDWIRSEVFDALLAAYKALLHGPCDVTLICAFGKSTVVCVKPKGHEGPHSDVLGDPWKLKGCSWWDVK